MARVRARKTKGVAAKRAKQNNLKSLAEAAARNSQMALAAKKQRIEEEEYVPYDSDDSDDAKKPPARAGKRDKNESVDEYNEGGEEDKKGETEDEGEEDMGKSTAAKPPSAKEGLSTPESLVEVELMHHRCVPHEVITEETIAAALKVSVDANVYPYTKLYSKGAAMDVNCVVCIVYRDLGWTGKTAEDDLKRARYFSVMAKAIHHRVMSLRSAAITMMGRAFLGKCIAFLRADNSNQDTLTPLSLFLVIFFKAYKEIRSQEASVPMEEASFVEKLVVNYYLVFSGEGDSINNEWEQEDIYWFLTKIVTAVTGQSGRTKTTKKVKGNSIILKNRDYFSFCTASDEAFALTALLYHPAKWNAAQEEEQEGRKKMIVRLSGKDRTASFSYYESMNSDLSEFRRTHKEYYREGQKWLKDHYKKMLQQEEGTESKKRKASKHAFNLESEDEVGDSEEGKEGSEKRKSFLPASMVMNMPGFRDA